MATLSFKGKSFVQNHHLSVKYHQLVPKKDKSFTDKISLNDNLIIHGDNLIALKALLPTFAGKVKCVYVDVPYNTGNEKWVYNDNVNSPMMQEWLGKVVDREDFTRHDKWLCMMMPRLKLLRELLRDDGVIFVSIDDNEVHHLRMMMDEVFGEGNFLAELGWQKKFSRQSDAKYFSDTFELIIVYSRNISDFKLNLLPRTEKQDERYKNPDNDPRGIWSPDNMVVKTYSKEYDYPITTPTGRVVNPARGFCWRFPPKRFEELVADNRIWFGESGNNIPRLKRYLSEVQQGLVPTTLWLRDFAGDTQEAVREVKDILTESKFDSPKPVKLIKQIISLATDKDSIILDSFAGSGTTAHAVLALNKEDGGNRKFILVECEDYADKITAERLRRVIKGYSKTSSLRATKGSVAISEIASSQAPRNDKKGLGGTFSYFELGEPIEMESILEGKKLPDYMELARYIFYTATGEEFKPSKVKQSKNFIGETKDYEVYLFYELDIEKLKKLALTLDTAKKLGTFTGKKRLVFAPAKYLDLNDADLIEKHGLKGIEYCQLPFEIYKMRG